MKKIYLYTALLCSSLLTACNSWLDVTPETEQKESDQFSSYEGFCNALTGCYLDFAGQDSYGERLSITNIESLANLWYYAESSTRYEDVDLAAHTYTTSYAEEAIKAIYAQLFKTIAEANLIIKNGEASGSVISDAALRSAMIGEAYAIRAYCQFDVLRLFGQLPQEATQRVSLPYSETTSIDEMPAYYDFNAYVTKLKADLKQAETLLKDNDPACHYSFDDLKSTSNVDSYFNYRQSRLNYWAVLGLEARVLLYLGEKDAAYTQAMSLINATLDGNPVITMSGVKDFNAGYKLMPSECLFYLSKYNIKDYTLSYLVGGQTNARFYVGSLGLTSSRLSDLYSGCQLASHNRYLNWWNRNAMDSFGKYICVTTKYYWDDSVDNQLLYYKLVPMLRMSEIYLIAMECAPTLTESNRLYMEYRLQHAVPNDPDFTSQEELTNFLSAEYRREFFAEGQAFYYYKRTGATKMLWRDAPVSESEYILPLPITEYNPSNN